MSNELPYPPEKIWLQWHGDGDPANGDPVPTAEVTWSAQKVWRGDAEYIRADLYARLHEALKSLYAIAEEASAYGLSDTAADFHEWTEKQCGLLLPNADSQRAEDSNRQL